MRVAPRTADAIVAELAERIARVHDLAEGCSLVLDRIVSEGDFERAVLLVLSENGLRGAAWGIEDSVYKQLTNPQSDSGAAAATLAQTPGIRAVSASQFPELGLTTLV